MHYPNPRLGFTLLELLVVVLIIGILAAVALPQYRKAVEKSKATQALTLLKAVYQAQQNFYLANGTWATSFDELAVDVPWTGRARWADPAYIDDVRSNSDWSIELYRDSGNQFGVAVGRRSGEYKGAGFLIYTKAAASLNPGRIWCAERRSDGTVNFDRKQGDYCRKLFKGKLQAAGSFQRFELP